MITNRSMPRSAVIPVLVYEDVAEAVAWLCEAFGFRERWRAGGHRAQLAVGGRGAVVVTEPGARAGDGVAFRPPAGGSLSHALMVRVDDADQHHERARRHGARILEPPADQPYGERQYTAEDPGGHRWTFSQSIADLAPEDWGGTSAAPGGPRGTE